MGNSQSVSGQVGVGSHVPGDTVNKRMDTKREQRPDPSQTVETDKSSSRSDSEKEIEEMEVPDPPISYTSNVISKNNNENSNRVILNLSLSIFLLSYKRIARTNGLWTREVEV